MKRRGPIGWIASHKRATFLASRLTIVLGLMANEVIHVILWRELVASGGTGVIAPQPPWYLLSGFGLIPGVAGVFLIRVLKTALLLSGIGMLVTATLWHFREPSIRR